MLREAFGMPELRQCEIASRWLARTGAIEPGTPCCESTPECAAPICTGCLHRLLVEMFGATVRWEGGRDETDYHIRKCVDDRGPVLVGWLGRPRGRTALASSPCGTPACRAVDGAFGHLAVVYGTEEVQGAESRLRFADPSMEEPGSALLGRWSEPYERYVVWSFPDAGDPRFMTPPVSG